MRLISYGKLESVWPVHGSVLVKDGIVYCVAGRSTYLDGGLTFYRLDAAAGKILSEKVLYDQQSPQKDVKVLNMPTALTDILSCDGELVYMRSQVFDLEGERLQTLDPTLDPFERATQQLGKGAHLFCPTGFLDDTAWHRSYWVYGRAFSSGCNWWFRAGRYAPAGRIMVFDGDRVYLRTYDALLCIARTGPRGEAYEKRVQAETLIETFPRSLERRRVVRIPAEAAETKAEALARLADRETPDAWLWAGPFPLTAKGDPLEAIGGCAAARPVEGTAVAGAAFRRLDPKFLRNGSIDLDGPVGGKRNCESFYYTVLENRCPRVMTLELVPAHHVRVWLAGTPISSGQAVRLPIGRLALMIRVRAEAGKLPPFVKFRIRPRLVECDDPNAACERQLRYVREHAAVLERVVRLAPQSDAGLRARKLLRQAAE
jgi:hypothetical protein